jgi:hypothetical protein
MITKADIEYQITAITELFDEFITYNDSVTFTDSNEKNYVTSDTILYNAKKSSETAIQELEQQKRDSLTEYELTPNQDTTIFNICFAVYGSVTESNMNQLIIANDLHAINRTDIDPNNPIIKKNTKIIYYK